MAKSYLLRISIVLAVVGCLGVLFYLPYNAVEKKTIDTHNAEHEFLARQAAKGIEDTFHMYGKALRYFASHPSIVNLDTVGQRMLFDFYAIHKPGLVSVARLDREGNILHRISSSTALDEEILDRPLPNLDTKQPELLEIITPELILAAYAWPLEKENEPAGHLVFLVSFSQLAQNFLSPLKTAQGNSLWVINRDGIVLACPNPEHSGAHITDTTREADGNSSLLTVLQDMARGGHGEGSFEIRDNTARTNSTSLNHVVFMPILLPGGNYWAIGYATPEINLLANMRTFRNYWLLVSFLALFVFIILGYSLIRSMTIADEAKKRLSLERQLLELMDFTPIGIVVYDVEGLLKYANKSAREMWQQNTGRELDNINIFDFIHPDYMEESKKRFKEVMRGVRSDPAVIKLSFPGKIERSFEISTAPFNFSGQRCGVTVLQDVTQRLKNEEEQRRLALAVAHTNDSIVITDREGVILYVNPAFTRVTGYTKEEAIGRNPRMLNSGFQNQSFYDKMWHTLTRGQVWEGRLINRKKDGSTFTELASISPILDPDGNITHFVAVKRDISHEVQLESQLNQAQKMEAIGTLAGGIAHDFNNILGAIIGFTDISILQTPSDSPVYDNLKQIKNSGRRAADLVQQILTFSRMAVQKEKTHVSITPLLKETTKLLRASIPSTIEIKLDLNNTEAWVMADPVQIQQVLMNLCTNAFHAMSGEGGILNISLRRLPLDACSGTDSLDSKSCIEIKIADTGHGIDAAIIDRIFDPFFTTKDPGVGTGMGLSVVHGIIQDLDGMITVDSSDKGTCFTVLLKEASAPPAKTENHDFSSVQKGTESILIVDDEKTVRDTCRIMLEQLGYNVTSSEYPREALRMILDHSHDFDLVISDQTMPEMTGLELLQEVKKSRPDLPVILCTGYSEQLNEETARAMGASMYLMKPINFQQLAGAVRHVLDGGVPDEPDQHQNVN